MQSPLDLPATSRDLASLLQDAATQPAQLPQLTALLDSFGDELDARDHDGSAALHAAAETGHAAALTLLLDRGAPRGREKG